MTAETNKTIMITLADMLADKSKHAINNHLELICTLFSFDSGFVYELNQSDIFTLKERRTKPDSPYHEAFPKTALSSDIQSLLLQKEVLYLTQSGAESEPEHEMLEHFSASSLAIACVPDENAGVYGFISFRNTDIEVTLPPEKLTLLTVLLNILGKSVSTRMYKKKLFFAQNLFENILDNTGIDIYVNDFHSHEILYVNKSMAKPYGGKDKFMGHKCWESLFAGQPGPCEFCPQKKLIDDNGDPTKVYSWDYQRGFDGSWFRVFSSAFSWVDGRLAHVVSSADITDNKRNEELIHYMANYDSLTNLPNRRMLVTECENRINKAETDQRGYLLFFDIDGFKGINDNFGHDAGDEFLVQLGAFFNGIPMLKNAIYRNGGDEFVALIGNNVSEGNIRILARFIHERFQKPWDLKNGTVFCNTSIGVACFPDDGNTAEELVNKADQAMYHIKKAGGGAIGFFHELKDL